MSNSWIPTGSSTISILFLTPACVVVDRERVLARDSQPSNLPSFWSPSAGGACFSCRPRDEDPAAPTPGLWRSFTLVSVKCRRRRLYQGRCPALSLVLLGRSLSAGAAVFVQSGMLSSAVWQSRGQKSGRQLLRAHIARLPRRKMAGSFSAPRECFAACGC